VCKAGSGTHTGETPYVCHQRDAGARGGRSFNNSLIKPQVYACGFFALGIATEILFVLQGKKIAVDRPTRRGMP
jgi:hypothetical protein